MAFRICHQAQAMNLTSQIGIKFAQCHLVAVGHQSC